MIQDIFPSKLNIRYVNETPEEKDYVFFFEGSSVLAKPEEGFDCECPEKGVVEYPQYKDFLMGITSGENEDSVDNYSFTYLFSVDDNKYFLCERTEELLKGQFTGEMADSGLHREFKSMIDGYEFIGVNIFRKAQPKATAYAAITAYHLYGWYRDNRFCGRCGSRTIHDDRERMIKCSCCGNMIFPKICPAVIVAVTNKDKILLTKYAGRTYKNYALIAGFNEVGETLEETVLREVKEEVGLDVKNITYYKSQPWGLSGSVLAGYYCEVDGNKDITLQEDELSFGKWFKASELDVEDDGISLTREMIEKFKNDNMNM